MSRKPQPAKTGLKPPLLHRPKGHDLRFDHEQQSQWKVTRATKQFDLSEKNFSNFAGKIMCLAARSMPEGL